MKIHLISIGGAVMHNMALALQQNGHEVTGSDDEIFEPSYSRLAEAGLLPPSMGWDEEHIHSGLDLIILGMHARANNPELRKAVQLGIKVMSFPEYVAEHAREKMRVVVAGSHGKTTTTAMIMHVLKEYQIDFDYLVGSKLEGFDTMVRFSDAPIMVIEGDEYLSSAQDPRPKFLWYKPHYSIITGIAWDHINVFPTFETYVKQFDLFIDTMVEGGTVFYYQHDEYLRELAEKERKVDMIPYKTPVYSMKKGTSIIDLDDQKIPTQLVGKHNLENMKAAALICQKLGVDFNIAMRSIAAFSGTARRLEKWYEKGKLLVFRDFAHSPSKLKATIDGVRDQYPDKKIYAFFELHTFSSLKAEFLPLYHQTMDQANEAVVFYHSHVFQVKKMPELESQFVADAFGKEVEVLNETWKLHDRIQSCLTSNKENKVVLLMSSGTFDGLNKELMKSWL